MKKIIALVFISCLIGGCKTWDISRMNVKNDPLPIRLLSLEKKIEDLKEIRFIPNEDRVRLFTKEVEENLTDAYGDKYGYIMMSQNIIDFRKGTGWLFPNAWTLCSVMLLGCPLAHYKHEIEVELRITDSKDRLIAKYSSIGRGSEVVAMYYGYTAGKAMRKSYIDALRNAFDQMRPQIQKDVSSINEKLKLAGKI